MKNEIIEKLEGILLRDKMEPWNTTKNLQKYVEELKGEYDPKPRTSTQNNSLHLWFELLANALNDAGYTVQLVLKEKIDIDWDKEKVKELLWRPAQKAILGKKSTTELSKLEDIDKVYDHLTRHMGEKFGLHVPFPDQGDKPVANPDYHG